MNKWMPWIKSGVLGFLICGLLTACSALSRSGQLSERQITARTMWQERCKKSGEFIHKTVDGVEGVILLKLRPDEFNRDDQFKMSDPYGQDMDTRGREYIESFLRDSFQGGRSHDTLPPRQRMAYLFVEATDPTDGKRYRYTGRVVDRWETDKSYLKGSLEFISDKQPAPATSARYGVTYEDISTRQEREYWIAGSSLKVIDLQTGEVMAERIGYMYDRGQGNRSGGRAPWLFAADNACPPFRRPDRTLSPASASQSYQTVDFVEKVLRPAK